MSNCIFCRIAAGELPATKLYEDEDVLAFRDLHPQAPTHILIIPRRHIATLNDLTPEDTTLVGKIMLVARQLAADEGLAEAGYRTVFNCNKGGGQEVYHIHLHLLGGRQMHWPPG